MRFVAELKVFPFQHPPQISATIMTPRFSSLSTYKTYYHIGDKKWPPFVDGIFKFSYMKIVAYATLNFTAVCYQ